MKYKHQKDIMEMPADNGRFNFVELATSIWRKRGRQCGGQRSKN